MVLESRLSLDLLHQEPPPDLVKASEAKRWSSLLTFGFARGTNEAELVELTAPRLRDPSFARESFEGDLFLDELIDGCFAVVAGGRRYDYCRPFLRRVLVSPPDRLEDAVFRQGIFEELSRKPELARGLEAAYVELRAFRAALAGADGFAGATSLAVRRRIDILSALRKSVHSLRENVSGARSGLERIARAVERIEASQEFERLERLLSFEDRRAVLESRLQIGYDGTLRRFDIVSVSELTHPGFSGGAPRRFWRRLVAFFRGFRFSEEDVMSSLLDQVFSGLEDVVLVLLQLSLQLEFYLGGLGFRRLAEKEGLAVCLPRFTRIDEGGRLGDEGVASFEPSERATEPGHPPERELLGLFNPWLLAQGKKPVPCDLEATPAGTTVILTGPNSGGKTRLLQAISAAQLLGQVGLFVPAASARLIWVEQLFLSLLERAHADQEEGRLGMELLRIRRVFQTSGQASLIVMDELCSGTNPSEGEEIFEMVLELFEELRPQVLISTHFLDFAARLAAEGRFHLRFLQVELGPHDTPTYRFMPGVAQTSLARTTAGRLGVTKEELHRLVEDHKRSRAARTHEPS